MYVLWALLLSCASIQPEFNAARDHALKIATKVPDGWAPDAILQLDPATQNTLLQRHLKDTAAFDRSFDLKVAAVDTKFSVAKVAVRKPDAGCTSCPAVFIKLDGDVDVKTAIGGKAVPASISLILDLKLDSQAKDRKTEIIAKPFSVRKVKVEVDSNVMGLGPLERELRAYITDSWLQSIEPVPVTSLNQDLMPVRALRFQNDDKTMVLEVLTDAFGRHTIVTRPSAGHPAAAKPSDHPISVELANTALVALARRKSFGDGPIANDVTPEPTSLSFDGSDFELGLRLWRTKGKGWWRDYTIRGKVEVWKKKIKLVPDDVQEIDHSKGAGFVDPLAALGKGIILKTLEDALTTAIPRDQDMSGTTMRVTSVLGTKRSIQVHAELVK